MSRVGRVSKVVSDTMASLSLSLQGASSPTATPAPAYVDYQLLCRISLTETRYVDYYYQPLRRPQPSGLFVQIITQYKIEQPNLFLTQKLKISKKENILMFILRLHHYIMLYQHYMISEI